MEGRRQYPKMKVEMVKSKCCKSPVYVKWEGDKYTSYVTNFYVCTGCKKPCDIMGVEEEEGQVGKSGNNIHSCTSNKSALVLCQFELALSGEKRRKTSKFEEGVLEWPELSQWLHLK